MTDYSDATRAVRAGLPEAAQGEPFLPGPVFASAFHLRGDPDDAAYSYARFGHPTWNRVEAAIAELEGGEAVLFASGTAAVAAVMVSQLDPEAPLVLPTDSYMDTRRFAELHHRGELRWVRTAEFGDAPVEGAGLVFAETPSNPLLDVCDLRRLAERAHAAGAALAVDNTTATPLGQRPLDLGADLSVASAAKALAGHSDLVMGYVATRDPARAQQLREWRTRAGSISGPFETWLLHRSMATLEVRLSRQCANALAIAELLAGRDDLSGVRFPGLPSDPAHEVAAAQMTRFGPLVSFDVGSRERAELFLASCELVTEATSFGGVHTTAERRARWGGDDVPEGFIRLSAGCEDAGDLLADLSRALDG
jgi:cystathionine gamma-lyase